jgi:hypothetical protein
LGTTQTCKGSSQGCWVRKRFRRKSIRRYALALSRTQDECVIPSSSPDLRLTFVLHLRPALVSDWGVTVAMPLLPSARSRRLPHRRSAGSRSHSCRATHALCTGSSRQRLPSSRRSTRRKWRASTCSTAGAESTFGSESATLRFRSHMLSGPATSNAGMLRC